MSEEKNNIESTLKSMDTEEFIDIHFYRPIGYRWALLFRKLHITPNAVTIASIFIGIAAGVCFGFNSVFVNILGMLFLIWANMYDSADGQLARMTNQKSPLGRILDGFSGDVWFFTIYFAICWRLTPEWLYWIWLLAAATGFCHGKQAAMADYYRNIHLLFLKGKDGSELSHSPELKEHYKTMSWSHDFIYKLFDMFYIRYTEGQEQLSPQFQKMMNIIRNDYDGKAPEWFRTEFRALSLPLMKYTNMLSFNTRVIALFIALLIGLPYLYFLFEITVLNIMLIYMVRRHEKICRSFILRLTKEKSVS